MSSKSFQVFNHDDSSCDFTYIDYNVTSNTKLVEPLPAPNPDYNHFTPNSTNSSAPYQVFNIGNNNPVLLMNFVQHIEEKIGMKAITQLGHLQPGDVPSTYADVQSLFDYINFKPSTSIKEGIDKFVDWYRAYYSV